ncbi:hypothetical protein [Halomarina rubra]|uniref:C2H2-type domain-containing protein n=1 Tax=Halomarina rubra TaxID=2071873 RepID=A0ABD6AXE9_9EURY|nr:hypothetical protein [Halomarina rubra]
MTDTTAYLVLLECPLCHHGYEHEDALRDHLQVDHSREDLANFVVRAVEERESVG